MANPWIAYEDFWRNGELYGASSEAPQFAAEYTQDDTRQLFYRSRYGTGTGNGRFIITGAGQIVPNGSFTSDATSWSASHCTLASVAGGVLSNCLQITRVDSGGQDAYQEVPGFTIGASYTASVYVKSGTSGNEAAGFQIWNSGAGASVASNFAITSSATWTRYVLTFTAPATTLKVILRKNSGTAGTMLFDEVLIVENAGNNKLDFQIGTDLFMAALTAGTYNGQTLATEVATQLDAASGGTFTCVYDEATAKFTIARAAGNFSLLWNTGTHAANDASVALGFSAAADDTGAATYTSDTMVSHTSEYLACDFGTAQEYDTIGFLGHNLSASATVSVEGADDDAFTTNLVTDALTYAGGDIWAVLGTARTKRYVRFVITDPANTDAYVEVAVIVVSKSRSLDRGRAPGYAEGPENETTIEPSPSGADFTVEERPSFETWDVGFRGLGDTAVAYIKTLLDTCGAHKAFVWCPDSTYATACYWVRLREMVRPAREATTVRYGWEPTLKEVL